MIRRLCTVSALMISAVAGAQTLVRFQIAELPSYHDTTSQIFMAGSFNSWNPRDGQYRFTRDNGGQYFLELRLPEGTHEFKLTRGGWNAGECSQDGSASANRTLIVKGPRLTERLEVKGWADNFRNAVRKHTASSLVQVMSMGFEMPQLQTTRRIWIYLPRGYESNPAQRYPVLYMHDGQNLFDDATSYAGEWGIDEFLDTTKLPPCIVVGIDNGPKRMNEYNPFDSERFGKGEGDAYVDFIVQTLKPFIDSGFRTMPGPKHTIIAGSSMGGLISFYALLRYPTVFGGAGVFSPSFWIAPSIEEQINKTGNNLRSKIFFYAGTDESLTMVSDMEKVDAQVKTKSLAQTIIVVRDGWKHSEAAWRSVFPDFYNWMMSQ